MKKIASFFIITIILFVSVSVTANISSEEIPPFDEISFENVEELISGKIPFRSELLDASSMLRYASGVRHFDDIYIGSEGSLLKDIEKPTSRTFSAAKNYILSYSEKNQIKPYFMLIPTASVIIQQEIDDFAREDIYNQRYMISQMYSQFDEKVRTADVFQTLYDHRGEYIYYHTEDMPTSLGGYYIYGEICSRLGIRQKVMDDFSSAYLAHGFYGSLATDFFRPYASSDFITLYEYMGEETNFVVEHYSAGGRPKIQKGLFVYSNDFENPTDMFLGGISPMMNITCMNSSAAGGSILVFGDETAKSWLPFLAVNYKKITFVDLNSANPEVISKIKTSNYDQVLFAYSTATFTAGIDFSKLEYIG
ncbi:MAG: hypothetical protein IKL57_06495 [Oscillospiraceae bacterium]|nr:hypothetical protein [Oscillospiraceae bacterium]